MTNDVAKRGSQILADEYASRNLPAVGVEALNTWLEAPATNRDLYDALYEQAEVNVRIAQAVVDAFGDDREKQAIAIQDLLGKLRQQTASISGLATQGVLQVITGKLAGLEDE